MIHFTKHALERLKQRNIKKTEIVDIALDDYFDNNLKDRFGNYILQLRKD